MICSSIAIFLNIFHNGLSLEKFELYSDKLPKKKSILENIIHSKLNLENQDNSLISFQNNSIAIMMKNSLLQYTNISKYTFAQNRTFLVIKPNELNASILSFLGISISNKRNLFEQWMKNKVHICGDSLIAFENEFALSKHVILNTKYGLGRKGDDEIKDVLNQDEEAEYYSFQVGFLELSCDKKIDYYFNSKNHLNLWYDSLQSKSSNDYKYDKLVEEFTIAITRYEYVNIYHTMTDIYNCYLLMRFFNKTREETNILIIDGHPKGSLDNMWKVLFNSSQRIGNLNGRLLYRNLAWGILGYHSEIMQHLSPNLPFIDDFSNFVLKAYGLEKKPNIDCTKLKVLFVWRRDYLAHPRNPSGKVSRKIRNEDELIQKLKLVYPQWDISGVQLDTFDLKSQLNMISKTDILVGMHGAGLTQAFFLPNHSALLEIVPNYWQRAKEHFQSIATWRHLIYQRWTNNDPKLETDDQISYIPTDVILTMTSNVFKIMCKKL